jgi:hypothetical protein
METRTGWAGFPRFALRVIVAHTLTYLAFGVVMANVLGYAELFQRAVVRDYMLAIGAHSVVAGPLMQPVRGLVFAIGLWPLRGLLVAGRRGWLVLWGLLVTIGIVSTPAASPGSIEGMLYTRLPMWYHLIGYPEIVLQTLAFSVWLVWWERQPAASERRRSGAGPVGVEIAKAMVTACFAWIGYAVGGLLLAARANARAAATGSDGVDIAAAGANVKMQLMFVAAFLVNAVLVFLVARRWQANRIALGLAFLVFWLADALVPWLYQTAVFGGSHVPTAILLGFLPAVAIAAGMRLNYARTPATASG